MKNKLIFLFAIGVSIYFYSCKKNNDEYPKSFNYSSYVPGKLRMFTSDGEVFDSTKIDSFVRGYHTYTYNAVSHEISDTDGYLFFNFKNNSGIINYWNFNIELLSDDSAKVRGMINKTKRLNGVLYFISKDTVHGNNFLIKNIKLKYFPFEIYSYYDSSNPSYNAIFIPCIYAYEIDNEIHIPLTGFVSKSMATTEINNVINLSYLQDFKDDTIVFQEGTLIYKRE